MMLFFFILYIMLFMGRNSFIFCDILLVLLQFLCCFIMGIFKDFFFIFSKKYGFLKKKILKIGDCDINMSDFYAFLLNNTLNTRVRNTSTCIRCCVFFAVFLRHLRRELWAGLQGAYLDPWHTCHHVHDLYVRVLSHVEATSLSSLWEGMKLWHFFLNKENRWYLQNNKTVL